MCVTLIKRSLSNMQHAMSLQLKLAVYLGIRLTRHKTFVIQRTLHNPWLTFQIDMTFIEYKLIKYSHFFYKRNVNKKKAVSHRGYRYFFYKGSVCSHDGHFKLYCNGNRSKVFSYYRKKIIM
jgi:hypothetical protein